MRNNIHTSILVVVLVAFIISSGLVACSKDAQNKIARKKLEYSAANYKVTFVANGLVKEWNVVQDKVTSEPSKGYYLFWANVNGKKLYVQSPIERTIIEETE